MLRLWDVKSKTWNKKHFRLHLTLTEFCTLHFHLGFRLSYSRNMVTQRYKNSASAEIDLGFFSLNAWLDWGAKWKIDNVLNRAGKT